MKYLRSKLIYSIYFTSIFIVGSCTKNVAGPKGDPGPAGGQGNVLQSHTSSVTISSFAWDGNAEGWKSLIYVPQITTKVIEVGEVKVYIQIGTSWWCLPHSVGDIFTRYSIEEGIVHLSCTKIHGLVPPVPLPANYRVVVFSTVQ